LKEQLETLEIGNKPSDLRRGTGGDDETADLISKAMAKKISWLEAAEIIGVCGRTMRHMRKQYEEFGHNGLFDQRRRKRTYLRVPMETAERVLALYQETYFDLSVWRVQLRASTPSLILAAPTTGSKRTLLGHGLPGWTPGMSAPQ
jgi:hypothetical protein